LATGQAAALTAEVQQILSRYRHQVSDGLRDALADARRATHPAPEAAPLLDEFHSQIEYHLGWRTATLAPMEWQPGKLLRPTLLLLACDLAAGRAGFDALRRVAIVERAIPAAVSVELIHNFSLVHDDIEDGDAERHHRPTLWKLWGMPQAINTGDGIFSVARSPLWRLADAGVDPRLIIRLAALLDRACLELCEGQFLDMRYEGRQDVSPELYLAMIDRKTAALMAAATEIGALLATPEENGVARDLAAFGRHLGLAFQLRDDLLGIWAAEDLGKTPAGDLRHKKMSLPVIHALHAASGADRAALDGIYGKPGPATEDQIAEALDILDRTGARERVRAALQERFSLARAALDSAAADAPQAQNAHAALTTLLAFVVTAAR
jgi:geranylgeranyl diphosphate synthase type I